MPYLSQIGSIPQNTTGIGSRGYHVYRRGTRVRVVWGPVDVIRGRSVRLAWSQTTMHKDYRCRSVPAAKATLLAIVDDRLREGYTRLMPGARILRPAHAAKSTRRP